MANGSLECQKCSMWCDKCEVNMPGKCDPDGCKPPYVYNDKTMMCECAKWCDVCTAPGICDINGCKVGFYLNLNTSMCERCSSDCTRCNISGAGSCDECNTGYGFTTDVIRTCGRCAANCLRCPTAGATFCNECINGFELTPDKHCAAPCNLRNCELCNSGICTRCLSVPFYGLTPDLQGCEDCSYHSTASGIEQATGCLECDNITQCRECEEFNEGPNLELSDGTCGLCSDNCFNCQTAGAGRCNVCTSGYGVNNSTKLCDKCASNCTTCSQSGPGKCDTCLVGHGLTRTNGIVPNDCAPCTIPNCVSCYANYTVCESS